MISKEELANKEWWEESYFSYHIIEISKLIEEYDVPEKIKGVKFAKWDKYSNKLSIIYNPRKNILDSIQKQIAYFGHDTEKFTAPLNIYKNLPECCYYRDSSIH